MGATPALVLPASTRGAEEISGQTSEERTPSRLFVVKALGCPEVIEETLFKELFGNVLARSFGIQTPDPAIVVLSEGFISVVKPQLPASTNINLRVGYAVGCEYLAGLQPVVGEPRLSSLLVPQAAGIYAFDLLCDNADRHVNNSNCALRQGGFLAYDFESAFGFLRALWGPKSWQVSLLPYASRHVFWSPLGRHVADWQPFVNCLQELTEARLNSLVKDWPSVWITHRERVFEHLLSASDAADQMRIELDRSLRVGV